MKRVTLGFVLIMLAVFLSACKNDASDKASEANLNDTKASGDELNKDEAQNGASENKQDKNEANVKEASENKASDNQSNESKANENDANVNKPNENEANENEANKGIVEKMNRSYSAKSDTVKHLGRTYYSNKDILWCAFSGSGAEFRFSGKKCTINIEGDAVSVTNQTDNHARIGIYVNDERVVDEMITKPKNSYTVIEGDEVTEAVIRIVKLSEAAMSTFGIASIDVEEGKIEPTEQKDLLIEFVGDSITCGYGVDDEDRDHHFSTKTEDVTRAFAYKTAEILNADYSMVALSGYGIISGYTTQEEPNSAQTIPQYYDTLGFTYGNFDGIKPQNIKWDFTGRQPDIIVINLGTNDSSYTKGKEDRLAHYSQEYNAFIKKIREHNPDATIICSLGIMGDQLYPSVELAVNTYIEETGDDNIELLKFDVQRQEDGYAADWHPTEATHSKAADKLVTKIRELNR